MPKFVEESNCYLQASGARNWSSGWRPYLYHLKLDCYRSPRQSSTVGQFCQLRRNARRDLIIDGLIAATALEHDLTLVTRNVKDYASLGVTILNPWEA
jgi:predicted nucleic acid-binding protein